MFVTTDDFDFDDTNVVLLTLGSVTEQNDGGTFLNTFITYDRLLIQHYGQLYSQSVQINILVIWINHYSPEKKNFKIQIFDHRGRSTIFKKKV